MTGISNEKMMKIIDQKNIELAEDYKTKGNIIVKKYQNEIKDEINFHRVEEWKLAKFNDIEYIKEIVNKYNFDLSKYGKYLRYIESEKWFILKNRIKKRDKNKCTKCNSNLNLQVHHLTYENLFNEKDEDLITLCSKCHKDFHKDDHKKFL